MADISATPHQLLSSSGVESSELSRARGLHLLRISNMAEVCVLDHTKNGVALRRKKPLTDARGAPVASFPRTLIAPVQNVGDAPVLTLAFNTCWWCLDRLRICKNETSFGESFVWITPDGARYQIGTSNSRLWWEAVMQWCWHSYRSTRNIYCNPSTCIWRSMGWNEIYTMIHRRLWWQRPGALLPILSIHQVKRNRQHIRIWHFFSFIWIESFNKWSPLELELCEPVMSPWYGTVKNRDNYFWWDEAKKILHRGLG